VFLVSSVLAKFTKKALKRTDLCDQARYELLQPIDQSEILVNQATCGVPVDQSLPIGQTHTQLTNLTKTNLQFGKRTGTPKPPNF
jgi:hypothetical protein